jgi:hypothetical protein
MLSPVNALQAVCRKVLTVELLIGNAKDNTVVSYILTEWNIETVTTIPEGSKVETLPSEAQDTQTVKVGG